MADDKKPSSYQERVAAGRWPFSLEFPISFKERLEAQAAREERSMAAVCRRAIMEYVDRAEQG